MTALGHKSVGRVSAPFSCKPLRSVLLASAAAALPIAAISIAPTPVTATAITAFEPSPEPMVLTRILRRPLPGGIEISTSRSYEVRFVRENGGYRIEGELLGVEIDVPKQFEALAALERARKDSGMFPMRGDLQGQLIAASDREQHDFAQQAGPLASNMVPTRLALAEARDARAFIASTAAKPVRTAWPGDLFRPSPGKHSATHVMPLPGGKTGRVTIETEAEVDDSSGLVTKFQRNVTTDLGDSTRVTLET